MNIFRLAGDMTHLMSIVLLLLKIRAAKNCRGSAGGIWMTTYPHTNIILHRHIAQDTAALCPCIRLQIP